MLITSMSYHVFNSIVLLVHHVAGGTGQRDPDPPCAQEAASGARKAARGSKSSGGPQDCPGGACEDPRGTGSAAGQLAGIMILHMHSREMDTKCHMMYVYMYERLSHTALFCLPLIAHVMWFVCVCLAG